jgi:hypothetical protein
VLSPGRIEQTIQLLFTGQGWPCQEWVWLAISALGVRGEAVMRDDGF